MSRTSLAARARVSIARLLGLRLSPLARLRRLFLLFGYVNLVVASVLVTVNPRPVPGGRLVGLTGVALLAVGWWAGRRGAAWPVALVDAAGILLVGLVLPDAAQASGLVWSGIFFRSMYGRVGTVAVHVAGREGALVAALVTTTGWSGVVNSGFTPQFVAMPVMAALMYVTRTSLLRYEQGRDRDRVLLEASTALVAAAGPEAAAAVARQAAAAIVADPTARITVLGGPPDAFVPLAADAPVAAGVPAPVVEALAGGRLGERPAPGPDGVVVAVPLLVQGRPGGGLVVRAARPVPASHTETLVSLANAVALAMESWSLAEDLNARRGEERYGALVGYGSDAIILLNRHGTVAYQTPSAEPMFGYPPGALVGTTWVSLLHEDDAPRFEAAYRAVLEGGAGTTVDRLRVRRRDGSWRHVEATATNLLDDPQVHGVVLVNRDITERVELEEQLSHQTFHDPLTGLANRALFLDRLGHALARSNRSSTTAAVILVDVDDFKTVNDSLGHGHGDRLLTALAERLSTLTRAADTVARLGGDEFALLIEGGEREAIEVAERIGELLRAPLRAGDTDVVLTASVGIVVAEPGDQVEQLLSNADLAMYRAKAGGRGRYERYRPVLRHTMAERMDLTVDLRQALARDELLAYYQPIVSLADGRIVGAEALLRWQHPTRGLVPPATFIPLAEETGLIGPIGRWILDRATAQAATWYAEPGHPLSISVNLSPRQLPEPDLVTQVAEALSRSDLPASALTLEITESVLLNDTADTIARLHDLKALGVRLAIDDFGTGYSSLGYLRRFPVDILKIDKSFVDDIAAAQRDAALSRGIVKLGRTLRLTTVAEGVEDAAQARELRRLGCDLAQGYHFARPMPAAELDRRLREQAGAARVR